MVPVTLGIPSKGRLMDATLDMFAKAGMEIIRAGSDRGYRGSIKGVDGLEIAFLSASEIAQHLKDGKIDAGITGEDLLREAVRVEDGTVTIMQRLGFGPARVVVAVPECWIDVNSIADLDEVAEQFYRSQGYRIRVATKYRNLTRRFFAEKGVTGYRIVNSIGATEGAPAAGTAELIVDITTTGNTLSANHLKLLEDGLILDSCAVLSARETVTKMTHLNDLMSLVIKNT
jgi:ATP phosphoribosyltransferase